jgi:hypothetical protein
MSRYRLNNYEKPYLWLDVELCLYANEARNIICRDGKILEDSRTVSVCQFSTVADQFEYALNPVIIYIRSLKIRTQETMVLNVAPATPWSIGDTLTGNLSGATCVVVAQLTTTSYTVKQRTNAFTLGEVISNGSITADQGILYPQFNDSSPSTRFLEKKTLYEMNRHAGWRASNDAQPVKFVPDYNSGYLTLYPKPNDIYIAEMSVIRYPLVQFSSTSMSAQSLEISPQWADVIVEGICYQAYQKRGDATYDPKKAADHYAQFRKGIDKMQMTQAIFESNASTAGPVGGFV